MNVEELQAGDVVTLPSGRDVEVQLVDRYEEPRVEYVVRWRRSQASYDDGRPIAGGELLGSLRPMAEGEAVDARRPTGYSPAASAGAEQTRSRSRLADNSAPVALPSPARARPSDPATSHAAARSLGDLRPAQDAVLGLFRELGEMSDEVLVEQYLAAIPDGLLRQTPSGIRTRRHELAEMRALVIVGETMTRAGRACNVWALARPTLEVYDPEPPL